jgi:hypothetical protein
MGKKYLLFLPLLGIGYTQGMSQGTVPTTSTPKGFSLYIEDPSIVTCGETGDSCSFTVPALNLLFANHTIESFQQAYLKGKQHESLSCYYTRYSPPIPKNSKGISVKMLNKH